MVILTIIVCLPFKIHLYLIALRPSSSSSKVYTLFSHMDPLGFYGLEPFVGIRAHHRFSIARRFIVVYQHDLQDRITYHSEIVRILVDLQGLVVT